MSPGAKYTVHDRRGPRKILTVAKVVRTKLVMTDKTEWHATKGQPWGTTNKWYIGDYIYPHTPEDDGQIARRRLLHGAQTMLDNVDLVRMPDEAVQTLIEALRPWQKEKKT